jgi:hypothetical protein
MQLSGSAAWTGSCPIDFNGDLLGEAMRSTWPLALTFAVLGFLSGCKDTKPVDSEDAMARVDAALQIVGHNLKDEALATACRDAAKAGAPEAVLKGIPSIVSHNLRDQVAEDCAYKLRDAGKATAATEVASLITSHNKRDDVLKKLASGS